MTTATWNEGAETEGDLWKVMIGKQVCVVNTRLQQFEFSAVKRFTFRDVFARSLPRDAQLACICREVDVSHATHWSLRQPASDQSNRRDAFGAVSSLWQIPPSDLQQPPATAHQPVRESREVVSPLTTWEHTWEYLERNLGHQSIKYRIKIISHNNLSEILSG